MDSNVISSLTALKNVHNEIQGIQNEIKQFKNRFKDRLIDLKKQQHEIETTVIKYLEKNNEPGIQYQNQLYLLTNDNGKTRLKKEDALIEFFKKYNIQNPNIALEEVKKIFPIRSKKNGEETSKKIKIKPLS
jgi:hypothetical protein